ncbi:MAG: TIGR02679 family protein [Mycobacteriales bacterium]
MTVDLNRVARLLGEENLAWLVVRARRRMERGESLDTTVTRTAATAGERAAVHRLLGRAPRPGSTLTVSLPAVDAVLRRSGACPDGLPAAVVALTGPVDQRSAIAAALDASWRAAFAALDAAVDDRPELVAWRRRIEATGLLRRLGKSPDLAATLLADLAAVIGSLPASGEPLGQFAARVVRSAHGLDDNRPLATLALGVARILGGVPEGSGAEWRREVWASVGLLRDELSATVLTLGLSADAASATGRALSAWRSAGQPVVLTLRQLVRDPPRLIAPEVVSICENPVVVAAAADRLGAGCSPLVCIAGQPGAAAMHLLRLLVASGAQLRYHGDFDWGGLRIGNVMFARLPLRPWRFDTASYQASVDRGRELTGIPVLSGWDCGLGAAMAEIGTAVEEELVLDALLPDLAL